MRLKALTAALAGLCVAGIACAQAPARGYLLMEGEWESFAVRTEPADLLNDVIDPGPERIHGARAANAIFFTVHHGGLAGAQNEVWVFHAFDRGANTTFGLLALADGSVLRAVTRHVAGQDVVTFLNAKGEAVSTETHRWRSPDEFVSESVFEHNGAPVRVWYVTRRVEVRQ